MEDVKNIEEIFEMDLGAKTLEERQHQKLTSKILTSIKKSKDPSKEILKAALIRKSLG